MNVRLIALISLCIQVGKALHVSQPYKVEASGGELRLRCSYRLQTVPEEMLVTLYQGMHSEQEACTLFVNSTASRLLTEGLVVCRGRPVQGGVDLVVSGLRGVHTDLYRCMVQVLYPPPYRRGIGNGTIFHIPEKPNCSAPLTQTHTDPDPDPDSNTFMLLLTAAFTILIIVIICITVAITYKTLTMRNRRRELFGLAPAIAKRVDCRFGYENFL